MTCVSWSALENDYLDWKKVYYGQVDHKLVVSRLQLKLEAHQKQMRNPKYDVDRLKSQNVRKQYQTNVGEKFAVRRDREDMDADERWKRFKITTNYAAKEEIGYKRKQHKPWITEASRSLSEKQRRLRVEAEDQRDPEIRAALRRERSNALHQLHTSLKHDENLFWDEKARELEEAERKSESHERFAAVNFLRRVGCGHTLSSLGVRNEDGIVVTNPHPNTDQGLLADHRLRMKRWRKKEC